MSGVDPSVRGPAANLRLSPSECHAELLRRNRPKLAYAEQPGRALSDWQAELRSLLRDLVGLPDPVGLPGNVGVSPRAVTLWRTSEELGTIEKLAFEAEPGADVVAYFCVPRGIEPPYPTVICLQGHSTGMHLSIGREYEDETRPGPVEGDRDFGLGAMRRGFAALCIEQRGFGERAETRQVDRAAHGCHDATMHALMLGRTLLGERILDVDRGIDYLAGRGDVDLGRLGVMGNSGGGTVSLYAAALLDRLRFAMPSCSFCTFADSIMSLYHCGDNYVPGLLRYAEAADVAGLIAPRPLVVVAGRDDPLFPLAGVEVAFDALREIYRAAGAREACRLVVGDGGHRFFADDAWPVLLDVVRRRTTCPSA